MRTTADHNNQRTAAARGFISLIAKATVIASCLACLPGSAAAHQVSLPAWARETQLVVPQARSFVSTGGQAIIIESVEARVEIVGQVATTRLDIHLLNPSRQVAEAALLLPVPVGAAVTKLSFGGGALEPRVQLLPAGEARRIYESIVRRMQDPALLEFVGTASLRSSVFPVPALGRQTIRIGYEEVMGGTGGTLEYLLPRSESLAGRIPWSVELHVGAASRGATVHSTSHALNIVRRAAGGLLVTTPTKQLAEPGPFRLTILQRRDDWSASMQVYANPEGAGGHFLLLTAIPELKAGQERTPREVTLVIDRSGSMAGGKLDQVRRAALQIIEGLGPRESFNLIDYSSQVARFAERPLLRTQAAVLAARSYLAGLRPSGGTNIHAALACALQQEQAVDGQRRLPIVLFLTDGLPTIGRCAESEIRMLVSEQNPRGRRVFTFGVGGDVNAALLDSIAENSGAIASYVMPGQAVELEVAKLFRRLHGPVFTDVELSVLGPDGTPDTRVWRDLYPARLPDYYEGDSLVLLGRYTAQRVVSLRVKGNYLGTPRSFTYAFEMSTSHPHNAFVPRLWAARKIAYLVDALRQAGATGMSSTQVLADPRYSELAGEIVRLSTRYGVLSEYTAFLALEGTELNNWEPLLSGARRELSLGALGQRSGDAAVYSAQNIWAGKQVARPNYRNSMLDSTGKRVAAQGLQQLADGAFLRRGTRWIESSLVGQEVVAGDRPIARVIRLGSEEHSALLQQLLSQGRQSWLSLPGEILLRIKGEAVLVQNSVDSH